MAYVILVGEDNSLTATRKERIMQRSKLVDTLWFLVNPVYKECNMTNFTVLLEYVLPISKKYCSEVLRLSDERYEEYLKYLLPFDTKLTSEAGKIELQLTFALADLDEKGNAIQRVRKTDTINVDIIPISAWSDIIPDSALSAIDQRLIKTDAQIKALEEVSCLLSDTKADNLRYDKNSNELQLLSGSKEIGNKITIKHCNEELKDGIPIVNFNDVSYDDENTDNSQSTDNVVEF